MLMAFLFFSLIKNIIDYTRKLGFYEEFKKQVKLEEKKNISLKTEVIKAQDPYRIEKTIRDRLNLQRANEAVVILPKPTPTPVIITPTPAPNWRRWWMLFFGN